MNQQRWICITLTCLIFVAFTLAPSAQEQQEWIGDRDDGSRAVPVHNIPLIDEEGMELSPDDEFPVPFSVKQTSGHPWIYVDRDTGTVLPLSFRDWQGAFTPQEAGLNDWDFVKRFGRHLPGGGVGEWNSLNEPDLVMRKLVSGPLEANCLACHNASPMHDQAEYANQVARENFRWASASTSGFAVVSGSAKDMDDSYDWLMPEPPNDPKLIEPGIQYRPNLFDPKKRVFFDIERRVPNERCYYCHTSVNLDATPHGSFSAEQDVHIAAGMLCVDCHRNGVDHDIVRGYPGESAMSNNPLADALTCEGCHIDHHDSSPTAGRFAAPIPEHKGLPPIHFEKLSCTACHSGPWPDEQAHRFKTSIAHGLGMHKINHDPDALPHIYAPVFAKGFDGKIAPHYALWPSYWSIEETLEESKIVSSAELKEKLGDLYKPLQKNMHNNWGSIDVELLKSVLEKVNQIPLQNDATHNFTSGRVYYTSMPTDDPYLWPMGHDVRPAAQSLGVRGCEDCHNSESNFFSGVLPVDRPYVEESYSEIQMIALMDLDATHTTLFNQSFTMRPLYKCLISVCAAILALIAIAYIARLLQHGMKAANTSIHDGSED